MNLRPLVLYTHLPFITDCYFMMLNLTPVTEFGYSLAGASAFIDGLKIPVTHSCFWKVISYLHGLQNKLFVSKRGK